MLNDLKMNTAGNYILPAQYTHAVLQGWQCPVCRHVLSPYMNFCVFCYTPSAGTINTTSTCNCTDCKCKTKPEFLTE